MQVVLALVASAAAADVVWLGTPSADERARVEGMDGYTGARSVMAFRAAATAFGPEDQAAVRKLAEALANVRGYEDRLDGEVVIMDDIQAALDALDVVREEDRDTLFAALAYQGFAVDRYFAKGLASDPAAAPWRADLDGAAVVRPWRDAAAMAPDREITPYEIAEAPQRVAFTETQARVRGALPGGLRVTGLTPGAVVRVDGQARDVEGSTLRVPPGRHHVHVEWSDPGQDRPVIVTRAVVELTSGGNATVAVDLDDAGWTAFLTGLSDGATPPATLGPALQAVGGEIWLARPGARDPELFAVTEKGVRAVTVPREASPTDDGNGPGLSVAIGAQAGWFASGDFYTQDPANAPHERSTVNSAAITPSVGVELDVGLLRAGIGLDAPITPGRYHVALSGESRLAVRPTPHLAIGLPWAALTVGYLLPYHPIVGVRGSLPLPGDFELRADGRVGLPGTSERANGSSYTTLPVFTVGAGLTWRLRVTGS